MIDKGLDILVMRHEESYLERTLKTWSVFIRIDNQLEYVKHYFRSEIEAVARIRLIMRAGDYKDDEYKIDLA